MELGNAGEDTWDIGVEAREERIKELEAQVVEMDERAKDSDEKIKTMKTALESALPDPTALKRPWPPYTLYMQTARVIIAAELGPDEQEEAVEAEGEKRWEEMCEGDKKLWLAVYTTNLMHYIARIHAYRAGNLKVGRDV